MTSPDWLGSPQHFIGGLVMAAALCVILSRLLPAQKLTTALLAIGLTSFAEVAIEVLEYPILYGDTASAQAYYDTIADLAATLAGALTGTAAIALVASRR